MPWANHVDFVQYVSIKIYVSYEYNYDGRSEMLKDIYSLEFLQLVIISFGSY